jgi:hypothetical protein
MKRFNQEKITANNPKFKLLNDNFSNTKFSLNPLMHFSKPTGENLSKQADILSKLQNPVIYFITYLPKIYLSVIREFVYFIYNKKTLKVFKKSININKSIIFVSHLIQNNGLSSKNELFYGPLPFVKNNNKIGNLILLVDHQKKSFARNSNTNLNKEYLLIPKTVSFKKLIVILCNQIFDFVFVILKISSMKRLNLNDLLLLLELAALQLSREVFADLYLAQNITEACKSTGSKKIVLTFEGHPFEVQAVKKISEVINTINIYLYILAPIVPAQEGLFKSIEMVANQATICVTGGYMKKYIASKIDIDPKRIKIVGSSKHVKGKLGSKRRSHIKNILFTPEGYESATHEMFEAALYCADNYPELDIVFRFHPNYPLESIKKEMYKANSLKNFRFSNEKLSYDLERASFCVYKSSAVSIQSLTYNLQQIYYSQEKYDLDPLNIYAIPHYKAKNMQFLAKYIISFKFKSVLINDKLNHKKIEIYQGFYSPLDLYFFQI